MSEVKSEEYLNRLSRQQFNTSEVVNKFLPKQIDLNKVIKLIERMLLTGTDYLTSSYLKKTYFYLAPNILPSKAAVRQVKTWIANIYCLTSYCLGYKLMMCKT